MDPIKKSFDNVKDDINLLNKEIINIKIAIENINLTIKKLETNQKNQVNNPPTIKQQNPTDNENPTHNPTDNLALKALKDHNIDISIGNRGVPTDRQTDRQTDNPTHFLIKNTEISQNSIKNNKNIELNIKEATEILESLDTIKKEIRLKFKHLTNQEMLIFSAIYQLEETNQEVTYKLLSKHLNLSESSIRDYTQRIISKGIPLKKQKLNNKMILLSVSQELRKIASLSTIINLRDL